jgi:hypothetical protein
MAGPAPSLILRRKFPGIAQGAYAPFAEKIGEARNRRE